MKCGYKKECEVEFNELVNNAWNNLTGKTDCLSCLNRLQEYDKNIFYHSLAVAVLSSSLGFEIGIENTEDLFIAALFHDFGKVFIPPYILNKRGSFNTKEREIMKMHPFLGYSELKKNTTCSKKILNGILDHHERVDGRGYGYNKRDSEISLFGKIIALADVYSAMVTKRIYREYIFSHEETKSYIKSNIGKLFNREIADIFLNTVDIYKNKIESYTLVS